MGQRFAGHRPSSGIVAKAIGCLGAGIHHPQVLTIARRVDADTAERQRFSSAILPAWARKSPQVVQVLPLLYLHGLSSSDFGPALEQFLGSAAGLSAATITRLTAQWQDDAEAFTKRSLTDTDYVYVWVDGIRLGVVLPLGGQPRDRGRRQTSGRPEELLQRRAEVAAGQAMQVQQRQPTSRSAWSRTRCVCW